MNEGKVSVIVPSYNHASFVKETIEGVWEQTYRPVELIVVDDASSDESPQILKSLQEGAPIPFALELLEENRGGLIFNQALALCGGEYLAACASDDVLLPRALEKLTRVLAADDRVQIVFGNGWTRENGELRRQPIYNGFMAEVLRGPSEGVLQYLNQRMNPFWIQSSLMRTSLVRRIGGQTEDKRANDGEFLRRIFTDIVERGMTHAFVDEPVIVYRLHATNMHKDPVRMREGIEYSIETQLEDPDKAGLYHERLTKLMATSLQSGDLKEAALTLSFLFEKVDDEGLERVYRERFAPFVEDLEKVRRDSGTGKWDVPAGIRAQWGKHKAKIAEQQKRIVKYRAEAEERKDEIGRLKRSPAWKIGRIWTKPFRILFGKK